MKTEKGQMQGVVAQARVDSPPHWWREPSFAGAVLVLGTAVLFTTGVQAQSQSQATQVQTQSQPQPGQEGNWGPAGPPPDVQNGRIPADPGSSSQEQSPATEASPQAGNAPRGVGISPGPGAIEPAPPPPVGPGTSPAGSQQPSQPEAQPAPVQAPAAARRAPYRRQPQTNAPLPEVTPSGPVTLGAGTLLKIRTDQPLDLGKMQQGDYFDATVAQNIYSGNVLAIPRGAAVTGRVVDVQKAGEVKGHASLTLEITSLELGGRSYPLATSPRIVNGPGKGAYTTGNTIGGAALGALIGAAAGGGAGAAVGAVAGGTAGLGASAVTSGPRGAVPPEALLSFHLSRPATIQPVSVEEARNLEQSSAPPEGRRQRRPGPPGPYGAPPYPYPYAYPHPYAYYPYGYVYPYRYRWFGYWR